MKQGTPAPLVKDASNVRLALVGKVADNDHPYSWSAILNGYDQDHFEDCPNTTIRSYLSVQPQEKFGIEGVRVTHIFCDDRNDAERIARFSRIPNIAGAPEDVIGSVDAVLIPTDIGREHLSRAEPFVKAGIPVFIDKPLTDCEDHLSQFVEWYDQGKFIMSSSCMRYADEFLYDRVQQEKTGALRLITSTSCRSWERYGIHALEAVYPLLGRGDWQDISCKKEGGRTIAHVQHASGVSIVIGAIDDMDGAFGCVSLYGTRGVVHQRFADSFAAFKKQLSAFIDYLRKGYSPYPFSETVELMTIIIAGIRSAEENGRTVALSEIHT